MKTRNGFVSNSSSTSFTMCFKGEDISGLYKMIEKYSNYFDLFNAWIRDDEMLRCSAQDVIDAIKSVKVIHMHDNNEDTWDTCQLYTIDEYLSALNESLERMQGRKCKENSFSSWIMEHIFKLQDEIVETKRLKERGINKVFKVHFGDHDGPFAGTDIGLIMDYEGRDIRINKEDFYVTTEQAR